MCETYKQITCSKNLHTKVHRRQDVATPRQLFAVHKMSLRLNKNCMICYQAGVKNKYPQAKRNKTKQL